MSRSARSLVAKAATLLHRRPAARLLPRIASGAAAHPQLDARRLARIIGNLPGDNPWQALEDVNHGLRSIHDAPACAAERRFALIDALDRAAQGYQARLAAQYFAPRKERVVEEKRIWKTLSEFWALLAQGYLDCARQCTDGSNVPRKLQEQMPVLAARGLRALRHQYKWLMLRYDEIPATLWQDCAAFTALAPTPAGGAARLALYQSSTRQTSLDAELARLAFFHLAAPGSLSPAGQHVAERLAAHFAPKFRVSHVHDDTFHYGFALDQARAPQLLAGAPLASPAARYFSAGEAREAARAMLAMTAGMGQFPPDLDPSVTLDPDLLARVLRHLFLHWAKDAPARAANREQAAIMLQVVYGYRNVLGVIAPESVDGLDFGQTHATDSWITTDISADGYGLLAPAAETEVLRVGHVLALRNANESAWQLGVVQRLIARVGRQRHIGLRLLTRSGSPVLVRTLSGAARGGRPQWAILLDTRPQADGSFDMLARSGLFDAREAIEAQIDGEDTTTQLEPVGLVESGGDFDRLRYRLIALKKLI